MPGTDWNSLYSNSSFENQYLDIFISHGPSASINIPTHKAGNTLDNILLENVYHFDDFMVINDLLHSDNYPFLFDLKLIFGVNSSSLLLFFYSVKQISSFENFWRNFFFTVFPSSTTVDSFSSHLNFIIPQTFSPKTQKTLE